MFQTTNFPAKFDESVGILGGNENARNLRIRSVACDVVKVDCRKGALETKNSSVFHLPRKEPVAATGAFRAAAF